MPSSNCCVWLRVSWSKSRPKPHMFNTLLSRAGCVPGTVNPVTPCATRGHRPVFEFTKVPK